MPRHNQRGGTSERRKQKSVRRVRTEHERKITGNIENITPSESVHNPARARADS